jgi:anti-sigma-K factor RskA
MATTAKTKDENKVIDTVSDTKVIELSASDRKEVEETFSNAKDFRAL